MIKLFCKNSNVIDAFELDIFWFIVIPRLPIIDICWLFVNDMDDVSDNVIYWELVLLVCADIVIVPPETPFIVCDWSKPTIYIEPEYESNFISRLENDDNSEFNNIIEYVLLSVGDDAISVVPPINIECVVEHLSDISILDEDAFI